MKYKILQVQFQIKTMSNNDVTSTSIHSPCSIHPQNTWRSAQPEVEEESKFLFFGLFFKHRRELVTGGKVRRTRCFPLDSSNRAKHSSCWKLFGAIPPLVLRVHTRSPWWRKGSWKIVYRFAKASSFPATIFHCR